MGTKDNKLNHLAKICLCGMCYPNEYEKCPNCEI